MEMMELMEQVVCPASHCPLSLRNVLSVHQQPVCEEQAWALCHQLCSLLERNFSVDDGQIYSSWKSLRLPGPDGIFLWKDGSVSFRPEHGRGENQVVIETEAQAVDYVGRLMYSCLDWGLGEDVERELDETLELLVDQMTEVDVGLSTEHRLQPICTISKVVQVCKDRLYNPCQAIQHYRSVCATLYSHTIELCNYLQIIQQSQQSLQNLILESENCLGRDMSSTWEITWKHLIDEMSKGVILRQPRDKPNPGVALQLDKSPFSQLLQDIQLQRYTLRKVKVFERGHAEQDNDHHGALLNFIRSGPKLRPVSERKLKPRVQNLKHDISLHELLMQEIRSTDPLKLLSSCRRRCPHTAGSSVRNLSFTPALSSTPLSLAENCRLSRGKQRAMSLPSSLEIHQNVKKKVPVTIEEVIKMYYRKKGKSLCDAYRNWRICSCCGKRSVYFTWHNFCSLCSRVMCPECCLELRLPFKWCINLPISFFKKIVLKESEESRTLFWHERWSWEKSRVPLVLVSSRGPPSVTSHTLAMRDWHVQDVCSECQEVLLQACDSSVPLFTMEVPQEI